MRKNICLILNGLGEGGVERTVLSLAHALSMLGCRVDIITLSEGEIVYPAPKFRVNIHSIKRQKHPIRVVQDKKNARSLRHKITEIGVNFDLFVSNMFEANRICKHANLPNIYYCIHTVLSEFITHQAQQKTGFSKIRRQLQHTFLMRKLYKNQQLIAVSHGVARDLLTLGALKKDVQTIYNPFDFAEIRQQAAAHSVTEQNYIIYVGRFASVKRHDILIKAYQQSGITQKLLLFGDHHKKTGAKIQQLVVDLNLQDKVIFKGFNPNPYPYIKNADALILSSEREGFGMVLVEALILGTPVVSTDCPSGPSEILTGALRPFLSPVNDVEALAKNIKKMVANPVKITTDYYAKFSAAESAKRYLALATTP